MTAVADNGKVMELWPDGAPNSSGDDTDKAELTVFLPDAKRATGRAIVICPGGGYTHLALQHEGTDWAPLFNHMGIAVAVLKYRMPHGHYEVPVSDAEQALRVVRQHAAAWHVDPRQVGIMGFSAGGHLASVVATRATGDAKPDFQVLFYPVITMDAGYTHRGSRDNLLGEKPKKQLVKDFSSELQVNRTTSRTFLALSDDDEAVPPLNAVNYYTQCLLHDVPASLHVYPTGGHGWGYRESFDYHYEMVFELKSWLQSF